MRESLIPSWEWIFRWSTIAAFVLGGAGVTAAFISTWVGAKLTDDAQKEFNLKLGDANARVGEAKAEAAKANASAAQANEKAEAERLARTKIEERIAPRRLSKEQKQKLREALSLSSCFSVRIASRLSDAEGADFAADISEAMRPACWENQLTQDWTYLYRGVFIATVDGQEPPGFNELKNALTSIGLVAEELMVPLGDQSISGGFKSGVLYLLIGGKP